MILCPAEAVNVLVVICMSFATPAVDDVDSYMTGSSPPMPVVSLKNKSIYNKSVATKVTADIDVAVKLRTVRDVDSAGFVLTMVPIEV